MVWACLSAAALGGDTFTFAATDGDWGNHLNWSGPENDFPQEGDIAIIPADKTCHVANNYRHCEILRVYADGVLIIEAPYWLKIGDSSENTTSIIGGEVQLEGDGSNRAGLKVNVGSVALDVGESPGNAMIRTTSGTGELSTCCIPGDQVLTVGAGITVKGNMLIDVSIENNGEFKVDSAGDTMQIDQVGGYDEPEITGTGDFTVSAGTLQFDDCYLAQDNYTDWNLSGGLIQLTEQCDLYGLMNPYTGCDIYMSGGELCVQNIVDSAFKTTGYFEMTGGTLDLDDSFGVSGGFEFSGGTLELAQNKTAALE